MTATFTAEEVVAALHHLERRRGDDAAVTVRMPTIPPGRHAMRPEPEKNTRANAGTKRHTAEAKSALTFLATLAYLFMLSTSMVTAYWWFSIPAQTQLGWRWLLALDILFHACGLGYAAVRHRNRR